MTRDTAQNIHATQQSVQPIGVLARYAMRSGSETNGEPGLSPTAASARPATCTTTFAQANTVSAGASEMRGMAPPGLQSRACPGSYDWVTILAMNVGRNTP